MPGPGYAGGILRLRLAPRGNRAKKRLRETSLRMTATPNQAAGTEYSGRQGRCDRVVFRPRSGVDVNEALQNFCDWLSNTSISLTIQTITWIIPAVQTVHILCVALVMSCMAMMDLRLIGVAGRKYSMSRTVSRFVPWVWCAVPVLLATGIILIIGEPSRELLNPYFRTKMASLAVVILITFFVQWQNTKDANYWEARKIAAGAAGVVSLLLWVGIVTCGRWIAYY